MSNVTAEVPHAAEGSAVMMPRPPQPRYARVGSLVESRLARLRAEAAGDSGPGFLLVVWR